MNHPRMVYKIINTIATGGNEFIVILGIRIFYFFEALDHFEVQLYQGFIFFFFNISDTDSILGYASQMF